MESFSNKTTRNKKILLTLPIMVIIIFVISVNKKSFTEDVFKIKPNITDVSRTLWIYPEANRLIGNKFTQIESNYNQHGKIQNVTIWGSPENELNEISIEYKYNFLGRLKSIEGFIDEVNITYARIFGTKNRVIILQFITKGLSSSFSLLDIDGRLHLELLRNITSNNVFQIHIIRRQESGWTDNILIPSIEDNWLEYRIKFQEKSQQEQTYYIENIQYNLNSRLIVSFDENMDLLRVQEFENNNSLWDNKYFYTEYDDQNNWTECSIKSKNSTNYVDRVITYNNVP